MRHPGWHHRPARLIQKNELGELRRGGRLIGTASAAAVAFECVVSPWLQGQPVLGYRDLGGLTGLAGPAGDVPRGQGGLVHHAQNIISSCDLYFIAVDHAGVQSDVPRLDTPIVAIVTRELQYRLYDIKYRRLRINNRDPIYVLKACKDVENLGVILRIVWYGEVANKGVDPGRILKRSVGQPSVIFEGSWLFLYERFANGTRRKRVRFVTGMLDYDNTFLCLVDFRTASDSVDAVWGRRPLGVFT